MDSFELFIGFILNIFLLNADKVKAKANWMFCGELEI